MPPTTADVKQPLPRCQPQLGQDVVDLVTLGPLERVGRVLEVGARVGQARIEKQPVVVAADVVVAPDLLGLGAAVVAFAPVEPTEAAPRPEAVPVGVHDLEQSRQLVLGHLERTARVGLPERHTHPDRCHPAHHRRGGDPHADPRPGAAGVAVAAALTVPEHDRDAAVPDPTQQHIHDPLRDALLRFPATPERPHVHHHRDLPSQEPGRQRTPRGGPHPRPATPRPSHHRPAALQDLAWRTSRGHVALRPNRHRRRRPIRGAEAAVSR